MTLADVNTALEDGWFLYLKGQEFGIELMQVLGREQVARALDDAVELARKGRLR